MVLAVGLTVGEPGISADAERQAPSQDATALDSILPDGVVVDDLRASDPCDVITIVGELARRAALPIGVEQPAGCAPVRWVQRPQRLPAEGSHAHTVHTAREGLDLVSEMTPFDWREVGGVVVVRPSEAWQDPHSLLTLPTARFAGTDMTVRSVLSLLLRRVTPSYYYPSDTVAAPGPLLVTRPLSFEFAGGSLLEALNAVVQSHGAAWWHLSYRGAEGPVGPHGGEGPVAFIAIQTLACCPGELVFAPVGRTPVRR